MTKRRKNKGYSLVEMIIVLAIIAIVAGMSLISITLIHSARAKEAATTVDSEIATLITKSKNMQCDRAGCQYAARIYKDEESGTYYYQKGYFNPSVGSYGKYIFTGTDSAGEGKGTSLSPYVVIKFTGSQYLVGEDGTVSAVKKEYVDKDVFDEDMNSKQGLYIRFSKDGICEDGVGDIGFYKRNGNDIAHQIIRRNGSHQSK